MVFPSDRVVPKLRSAGCVFAEDEARLLRAAAATEEELDRIVQRRAEGFPLEPLLGWAAFYGQRIIAEPGVFVPRRRSEFLVWQAKDLITSGAIVVDLCCGSGAVGCALAQAVGKIELHAVDIDPAAVRCARRNISSVDGNVYQGDLYDPLPQGLRGAVDVVIANAPYVPTEEIRTMPPEARNHEPQIALDGGADGIQIQRRVIEAARSWLASGGHLLIETSVGQAENTANAFTEAALFPRVTRSAQLDSTVVIGTLPIADDKPR